MEVVRHQAVGVVGAVASAGVALIIVTHPHPVKGIDELVVVLLFLKDILVVDASHHHVEDSCTRGGTWLARHLFLGILSTHTLYGVLDLSDEKVNLQ